MSVHDEGDTTAAGPPPLKPGESEKNPVISVHSGTSPGIKWHRWRRPKRWRRWLLFGIIGLFLKLFIPPVYELTKGPIVVGRYDRRFGETKATVGPNQDDWISTTRMSRHVLHAVIAAEDGRFYEHHGLDFDQMIKSYEINRQKKRYARGASTISQQVVKMAFLGREKTIWRKLREATGTVLMELILPKDKILEWYLNLVEFGDGVYGIKEGSRHYFKTKPELLTVEQAVHLALVLPSPNAWSKGLRRKDLTAFGQRRFLTILNTMRSMGFITKNQWTEAVTSGDFGRPLAGFEELMNEPDASSDKPEDPTTKPGDEDSEDMDPALPEQGSEATP